MIGPQCLVHSTKASEVKGEPHWNRHLMALSAVSRDPSASAKMPERININSSEWNVQFSINYTNFPISLYCMVAIVTYCVCVGLDTHFVDEGERGKS